MRVYVVGGGPSTDRMDWGQAPDGLVVACHSHAHRLPRPPNFQLCIDWVWWRDNEPREGSVGVWVNPHRDEPPVNWEPRGLLALPGVPGGLWAHQWTDRVADGVMTGGCSGVAALHLAYLLGADVISLVGIDQPQAKAAEALRFAVRCCLKAGVEVECLGEWGPA